MSKTFSLLPEQASTIAGEVDLLYWTIVGINVFFTLLIFALLAFLAFRYRSSAKVDRSGHGPPHWLEYAFMALMFFIVMGLFFWGAKIYFTISMPPRNAMEIFVTGRQWMWKVQHPNGATEINQLHVPVGQPIMLTMISEDVLHSFYVPAFRNKMDVLPGRYTKMWFEATKTGVFHLFCAEYCGTKHSGMIGEVVVMEPSAYQTWLAGGPKTNEPMDVAGRKVFEQNGCASCHEGVANMAPSLAGVYGSQVLLQGGQSVTADDAYLRESIQKPQAKLREGYAPIMPAFENQLSEIQIQQLIAYLKSLPASRAAASQSSTPPVSSEVIPASTSTPSSPETVVSSAQQSETPEALGEKLYNQYGCNACHNPSPANLAPALAGIYGHEVKLKDGQTVVVDDAYLVESILKPQAKIVDGYATPMPPFEAMLNEQQVQQLVAYIKSLKN